MHTCVFISLVAFFILCNNVAVAFQINVDDRVDVRKGRGDFNNGEVDDDDDSFSFSAFGKEKIGDARDIDCISRLFRDYVPPRRLQTDGTTQGGCEGLDQSTKAWFAVALAACKLELMGRPSLPDVCTNKAKITSAGGYTAETLKLCGKAMDLEQSQAHTTFLAHADNLCFYMEARSWKREQQAVMLALEASSNSTAHKLENISASASDAVALNKAALSHAELLGTRLIETDKHLTAMAHRQESSYSTISTTLSTLESYSATLLYLNSLFTTQLLVIQSISFYSVIMWILWTITAQPQALRARFWVIFGLAMALMIEGILVRRATQPAGYTSFSFMSQTSPSGVSSDNSETSGGNRSTTNVPYSTDGLPSWQAGLSDLLHYVVYPFLEIAGWMFENAGSSIASYISKISGGASDELLKNALQGFLSSYDSGRLDVNPLLWNVRFGFLLYASLCVVFAVYTHVDYSKITVDMLTQTVDMVSRLREEQRFLLESVKQEVSKMSQLKSSPFKWSPFPSGASSTTAQRDPSAPAAARRAEMDIERAAAADSSTSFVRGVGAFISQSIFGSAPRNEASSSSSALSLIVNTHTATSKLQRKRASSGGGGLPLASNTVNNYSGDNSSSLYVKESSNFDDDNVIDDPDYVVEEDIEAELSGRDYLPDLTIPYSADPRAVIQAYLETGIEGHIEDDGDPVSVSPQQQQLLSTSSSSSSAAAAPFNTINSSGKKRARRISSDIGAGTGLQLSSSPLYHSPAPHQGVVLSSLDSPEGPPIVRNYKEILRPRQRRDDATQSSQSSFSSSSHNPLVDLESPHEFALAVGITRMITMLRNALAGTADDEGDELPADEDENVDSDDDDYNVDNDNDDDNEVNDSEIVGRGGAHRPVSEILDDIPDSITLQRGGGGGVGLKRRSSILGKRMSSSSSNVFDPSSSGGKRRSIAINNDASPTLRSAVRRG